jgi:hypothetical protein
MDQAIENLKRIYSSLFGFYKSDKEIIESIQQDFSFLIFSIYSIETSREILKAGIVKHELNDQERFILISSIIMDWNITYFTFPFEKENIKKRFERVARNFHDLFDKYYNVTLQGIKI